MGLLLVSFFAGILTVLAPCVLPLLPIILGSSIGEEDKKRPYVIIASLGISIIIFSILLKATTLFITVNPIFWKLFSGVILILFGIITIFPNLWKNISTKLGFSDKSNQLLGKSGNKKGIIGDILVGFSLGPVFSSCSPTYALILAVILPASLGIGLLNLFAYVLGLSAVLLLIAIMGQKFIKKVGIVSNPKGIFKKILGIIFLIIGISIMFGIDKRIESYILDKGYLGTVNFEQNLIDKFNINNKNMDNKKDKSLLNEKNLKSAYFAGGCFWCMEGIFEAQEGVKEAITGYAGGTQETAKYYIVSTGNTKHREAVKVVYDPSVISYEKLVKLFWTQIDPTDFEGQFADKGFQYTTAIIYSNDEEKEIAEKSKKDLEESKKFDKQIATQIIPFTTFFDAEEYHQDYYKKSSLRYNMYKKGSGREGFIENNWEKDIEKLNSETSFYKDYSQENLNNAKGNILLFFHADWCGTCKNFDKQISELKNIYNLTILKVDFDTDNELKKKYNILSQSSFVQVDNEGNAYKRFVGKSNIIDIISDLIPNSEIMKKKLTPLQYEVTQNGGTEKPFDNEYWDNHEDGIYVDIVDGTPLFSSLDKFDSGTGWPSFSKPIDDSMVEENEDDSLFMARTEVKSKSGNSHLGHVFNDGPADKGGMRYCINSAALKFIPVDELEGKGYGKYLKLFE